jgi:hypothetical protein
MTIFENLQVPTRRGIADIGDKDRQPVGKGF